MTGATDAEGRTTRYVYDALGRVLQVIDGNGHAEQTYTYTLSGQIHTIKDANNNVTTYTYDGFDRLVATAYPDGRAETLTLDDAGRVLAVNTRAGQTITYAYDALDRLIQKNIPGGGLYTYAYDLANRIVNATGPGGPINHAYDTAGRLLNVTYPGGQQVGYAYDAASRRTKLSYPDGSEVTYQYDRLGRLTLVNQDPDGSGELPAALAAAYTYDALSRRTRLTNGNGTLMDYTYSLDGNIMALNHQWTGESATLNYSYDRTGLQTSYSSTDDRFALLFEALGTKTNVPNSLNQYVTAAGQSLTYDGNGNLIGDGTRTFTYDAANRLTTAQTGHEASYAYDPFDRRTLKTVDGQTTTYIYDGDEVIAEYDSTGLARKYILGPAIDEPILMEAGTNRYFYHANTLGSVIVLTGTTGGVEETYQYSVYGEVSQTSNLGNPYLFTGRRLDPETGLYYYRARYYDADLRRFLQPDPIGFESGMNLYTYTGNSPANWVDPYGMQEEDPLTGVIIGRKNGVTVEHYGTADHGPAHAHVKGGGPDTKIGPQGYPLKGQPELTPKQRNAVQAFRKEIRKELNKLGRANMRLKGGGTALGVLGCFSMAIEVTDAEQRAKERGVSPWRIMLEDRGLVYEPMMMITDGVPCRFGVDCI